MIIDPAKDIESSSDVHLLTGLLSMLVGQPCLKAEFSYGGEFKFHFGGPESYRHPKLAGKTKGAWVLGVRASKWRLLFPNPPLLIEIGWPDELRAGSKSDQWEVRPPANEEEIETEARRLMGQRVMDVQPLPFTLGLGLQIVFGDGANLVVCPNPETDEDPEPLADWELTTPYHSRLRCGPGIVWTYVRLDVGKEKQPQAS